MSKSFSSFRSNLPMKEEKQDRDQLQIMQEIMDRDHEILEALKDDNLDKISVLIITKSKSKKPEVVAGMIVAACQKRGLDCNLIVTTEAWISKNDLEKGEVTIKNHDGNDKDLVIDTSKTVVFVRAGALENEVGLALVSTLQSAGCFMINGRDEMMLCDNKMSAYTVFENSNILTPKTALVNNTKSIEDAHIRIGGKFPVIIKTLTGTQGIGVSKVNDMESMVSVIQSLWKYKAEILIQEFIPLKFDVRTVVLNGRIIASTKRIKPKGDFRSNRHMGAETVPYILEDEEKEVVIAAARSTGAYLVGVDHAVVGGNIYILECNGSPGLGSNFQSYDMTLVPQEPSSKVDTMEAVIKYIQNPLHRKQSFSQQCGYLEQIEFADLGPVRAKMDTGNGTKATMLKVDEMEVKGDFVTVKKNGKTAKFRIVGISKPSHMGPIDERPIVYMKLRFNNKLYDNVPIGLTMQNSHSEMLVNRDLLTRFKVSVNPNRKFVLSDYISRDDIDDV